MRDGRECSEELGALAVLFNEVPAVSVFGDDNHEAIRSQQRVIQERMTFQQAVDEFEVDGDYVMAAALDAVRWLRDDAESVAEGWMEMTCQPEIDQGVIREAVLA